MNLEQMRSAVDAAWEARDSLNGQTQGDVRAAVERALALLDNGQLRVAEKADGKWTVHQWLKKAVLLSFRLNDMSRPPGSPVVASMTLTPQMSFPSD